MKTYELVLIINPGIEEEKAKKVIDSTGKLVDSLKGKVKKTDFWGKKQFVYPIKKFTEGRYFLLTFELEPANLAEFEKKFRLSEDIIRYLLLNSKEK